jgi:hypothetical protein
VIDKLEGVAPVEFEPRLSLRGWGGSVVSFTKRVTCVTLSVRLTTSVFALSGSRRSRKPSIIIRAGNHPKTPSDLTLTHDSERFAVDLGVDTMRALFG